MAMTGRKVVKAVAWVVGILGSLGVVAVALAPRWINFEPVRKRIESAASSALGREVRVGRFELSYFPRLEVGIRKVELPGPGKIHGAVRSVSLSPVLASLLRGRFRIATIRVDGPDLTVDAPEATGEEEKPVSRPGPLQSLTPFVALASKASGMVVEIHEGRLAAARNGMELAVLSDLDVSVTVPPTGHLDPSCPGRSPLRPSPFGGPIGGSWRSAA